MKLSFSPLFLALSNPTGNVALDIDVCEIQVACLELRKQRDETTQPIRYRSRSCEGTERMYVTTKNDRFAAERSVVLLRAYLQKTGFSQRTYHEILKCMSSLASCRSRLAGWPLELFDFEFDVTNRESIIKTTEAGRISWVRGLNEGTEPIHDNFPSHVVKNEGYSGSYKFVINKNNNHAVQLYAPSKASFSLPLSEKEFMVEEALNDDCKYASL